MDRIPDRETQRLRAGMIGLLVGDAFGVPYEFLSSNRIPDPPGWTGHGTHDQPAGTYSDDGALALCLLASLMERRGLDVEDVGRRSVRWMREGYMAPDGRVFDIGRTTHAALEAIASGTPSARAGLTGDRDCGNGSLMRILPVALVAPRLGWRESDAVRAAMDVSATTHGHPRARIACALYTLLALRLEEGGRPLGVLDGAAGDLDAILHALGAKEERRALVELMESAHRHSPAGSGFVVDSFWSALWAVEGADDYVSSVQRAVSLGNDTDTTAAIAGGLAALVHGEEAIPAEWREELRGRECWSALLADDA